jgi:hypothetical protein
MITVEEYLGQHGAAAAPGELTDDIRANADDLLSRVNDLLAQFGEDRGLRSGWRPAGYNARTPGAATHSKHMTGQAVDIVDNDGSLDAWCLANEQTLVDLELWCEVPDATPSWTHFQSVAPRSGHRWFIP